MAYDDIKTLVNAESEAENKKAQAAVEAKKIIADARAQAEMTYRKTIAEAQARAADIKKAAEQEAAREAKEQISKYESECEAIKRTAALHTDLAIKIITDKVLSYEFRYV